MGNFHPKAPCRLNHCLPMVERKPWIQKKNRVHLCLNDGKISWLTIWNPVRSILGKWGEKSETLRRCCVDIFCLQEVKKKGQWAKMIGNGFKFLWKQKNGMGVIAANWLIGKVVGVERFIDRVMKVNIVIGDVVWEVVSCYYPQAGRPINEKEEFYELMDKVVTRLWEGVGEWWL